MPLFLPVLSKEYSPYDIDQHRFFLYAKAYRSLPVITSSDVDINSGKIFINGIELKRKPTFKTFSFIPFGFGAFFIPVGEIATSFDTNYKVELVGFKNTKGKKYKKCSFKLHTTNENIKIESYKEDDNAAKRVSDEGMVLLKNEGILPLKEKSSIALKGAYNDFRITATGAAFINPRFQYNIEDAIKENDKLIVDDNSSTVLYFISRGTGENIDNLLCEGEYYLTKKEIEELTELSNSNKDIILILNTGYPIEMKFISSLNIKAIIYTGLAGQSGALSLIDVITGVVNPSGRLASSWGYEYFDTPSSYNFIHLEENGPTYMDNSQEFGTKVYYEEKNNVGYRYFDKFNKEAAYLFGDGLSYSKFEIIGKANLNDKLEVSIKIKNSSEISGKYSVLIWVKLPSNKNNDNHKFAGFVKSKILALNESEEIKVDIPLLDFASFDENTNSFILEKGDYEVLIGGSFKNTKSIYKFSLKETKVIKKSIAVEPNIEKIDGINEDGKVKEKTKILKIDDCLNVKAPYIKKEFKELKVYNGETISLKDVKKDINKLDNFVSQLKVNELISLNVLGGSCYGKNDIGAAGRIFKVERLEIKDFVMSDGNSGVNIHKKNIGFPTSNVLANTFSKELAYEVGKVIAKESKENGISINLGPAGNLHRNVLCGRFAEYFSEDPILAGTMMGYQAKGLEDNGVLACYKHLFANNIEFERKSAESVIDNKTLRELYLKVFDKAFEVYKASTVMTSYNPVNGIYPCENSSFLNDYLRDELGFDGLIMCDWGTYDVADPVKMVNAGIDLLCPGSKKEIKKLKRAYKTGDLKKSTLQENAKYLIRALIKCVE